MMGMGQGTKIIKREGPLEEFGLRLKWAILLVVVMDAILFAFIVGAFLLGAGSLALLAFGLTLAVGLLCGRVQGWHRKWTFYGSVVVAGGVTGGIFANRYEMWNALFGGIAEGFARLRMEVWENAVNSWPLLVALAVVWLAIAWTGRFKLASIVVSVGSVGWMVWAVTEVVPLLALVWSRARYFLIAFLVPVPIAAVVLIAVAVQETFMPNASVTLQPATVEEWKDFGPFGLGFVFPWLRRKEKKDEAQAPATTYSIESQSGGNFEYDQIPYPRVGGAHGLARFYAAVLAGHATISESGSKAKAGMPKKYNGALSYGYSALQWRAAFVDGNGNLVPSLKDALYGAKLVHKVGSATKFTEKGERHAACFVRDHLGVAAVAPGYRGLLDSSDSAPEGARED